MKISHVARVIGVLSAMFFAVAGGTCVLALMIAPEIAADCGVTIMSPILAAVCFVLSLWLCVVQPAACSGSRTRREPDIRSAQRNSSTGSMWVAGQSSSRRRVWPDDACNALFPSFSPATSDRWSRWQIGTHPRG